MRPTRCFVCLMATIMLALIGSALSEGVHGAQIDAATRCAPREAKLASPTSGAGRYTAPPCRRNTGAKNRRDGGLRYGTRPQTTRDRDRSFPSQTTARAGVNAGPTQPSSARPNAQPTQALQQSPIGARTR